MAEGCQNLKTMKTRVKDAFIMKYGAGRKPLISFAPGRVNLIGEHTDYNGGHVFPCALSMGIYMAGEKRGDEKLRFYSVNMSEESVISSDINDLKPLSERGWTSYVKGVIWAFAERGMRIDKGMDIVVGGDIPQGAGLSSSAALEVAAANLIRELYGFEIENEELALIGKEAENSYVGMNCGIMDQFASAMGRKDNAIYLNTESLEYRYVPLAMEDKLIVITNTHVEHELASSAYNDRRRECGEALKILKEEYADHGRTINTLGEISGEEFEIAALALEDPILFKRARHAVSENERTLEAVKALEADNIERFGKLMNESHRSLRDDYEVSCRELDILAETAQETEGVYGSRMTGGGFGGCTVSIIDREAEETFRERLSKVYREKTGRECSFYTVGAGDGPGIIKNF